MSYKIKLERSLCSGHARCTFISPELFPIDEQGYSIADGIKVPDGEEALALRGVRSCPERALALVDSEGNEILKLVDD